MDVTAIASQQLAMQMSAQKQTLATSLTKMTMDAQSQVATTLLDQAVDQAKAANNTAAAGKIDILA